MWSRARIPVCGLVACSILWVFPAVTALGHHSFAMFDQTESMSITGSVTRFDWTNPHAYIEVDVPGEDGEATHWSVELGSPSILMRGGWKYDDLKAGDEVTLRISPLRSGDPGGLLVQATLPDGRVLGNGPGRGPAPAPAEADR